MAVMTDVTIRKLVKNKRIQIVPFTEEGLTPVGYDVFSSDITMIRQAGVTRLVDPVGGCFIVPAGAQFLAMTREQIALAPNVAATIHSQVRLVSLGMSHISTTIDPGWDGRLLLAMVNLSGAELKIEADQAIATIVFHTVTAPSKKRHGRAAGRIDIIEQDLLKREEAKLLRLGQGILDAAKPRLLDQEDTQNRRAHAEFLAGEGRRTFARRFFALLVIGGAIAAVCFYRQIWAIAQIVFPDVEAEVFVAVVALLAGVLVWARNLWDQRTR